MINWTKKLDMSLGGQRNSRGTGVLQRVMHACMPLAILGGWSLPMGMLIAEIAKGVGQCSRVKRGNNTPLLEWIVNG